MGVQVNSGFMLILDSGVHELMSFGLILGFVLILDLGVHELMSFGLILGFVLILGCGICTGNHTDLDPIGNNSQPNCGIIITVVCVIV